MSNLKTGLMYSELSNKVYWGTINKNTGVARSGKKDVTSDFIGVMLQKFPVGFRQNIECNGKVEAVVIVVDEEKSHKHNCASEMYDCLLHMVEHDVINDPSIEREVKSLLAKARGEKC